jgi:hypothetical protein
MIIALESKDSEKLSKFLHMWECPEDMPFSLKNIFTMMALNTYFYRRVYRVDDLILMDMKGFFEEVTKYAIYFTIAAMLISIFLGYTLLLSIGFYLTILFLALISPNFRAWTIVLKLKLSGHKEKITLPSKDYVINKLCVKYVSK